MVSSVELPILKKGRIHPLDHKDGAVSGSNKVILHVQMTKDEAGNEVEVPPVTAQQILARTRERKAKSTLLMAIPDEHLARFHRIKDAKTLWAAIKTRFGGNVESKKMQKNVVMLSMRVKRFYKKTRKKLKFNGKEPVGFDKTKVECFNCHRRWHFARDCRSARNSENMSRDAGNVGYKGRYNCKRSAKEEDENAFVVQDGLGTYDWSYQVEDEATDFALMAFTSNPSSSSSTNFEFNEKEVLVVKEEEVTEIVFDNCSSDEENSLVNDRFKKGKGYHAVPLLSLGTICLLNLIYHL
uniref:Ribonuclease H-like domain-containing protein n=1 Tax=Tanacetum cinerariifolium TaxID=118510 RepID=A0A6L2LZU8_TANCI|nr:ribonuclease H-like domain-containing protein [Tanacetum cinerariifolium]